MPRAFQLAIRRKIVLKNQHKYKHIWPIDPAAGNPPNDWPGWPENKEFALVLTHDVDSAKGRDRCYELLELERYLGFKSSFYFVPERYTVPPSLRRDIQNKGFEVGVHGLKHDGNLYRSRQVFKNRALKINNYLQKWHAEGFRSPAMHHNLDWIHDLKIKYDASTFDTDPFEPQSDSVKTIFPFWVNGRCYQNGYVELPYTLAQDHLLFIIMKEKNMNIWKEKLNWIAKKKGMALLNTHPDYMRFSRIKSGTEEYPVEYYLDFLSYIKSEYGEKIWHVLPKQMAALIENNRKP